MADISITAAGVVPVDGASILHGTSGETITAGKNVYKSSTTNKFMLADSNSATAEARVATGVALCGSSLNQPISVQKSGPITIGGTLTAGVAYYLSDTPGGLCPVADVGTGEYSCIIGMAISTTVLNIDIQASGVAL